MHSIIKPARKATPITSHYQNKTRGRKLLFNLRNSNLASGNSRQRERVGVGGGTGGTNILKHWRKYPLHDLHQDHSKQLFKLEIDCSLSRQQARKSSKGRELSHAWLSHQSQSPDNLPPNQSKNSSSFGFRKKQNPMLLEEGDSHRLAYSSFSSPVASSSSAYVSAYGDAVLYLDSVLDPQDHVSKLAYIPYPRGATKGSSNSFSLGPFLLVFRVLDHLIVRTPHPHHNFLLAGDGLSDRYLLDAVWHMRLLLGRNPCLLLWPKQPQLLPCLLVTALATFTLDSSN